MTRVAAAHEPPAYKPVSLQAGEIVKVGRRDDTWPAFLWCTCAKGEAWIPDAYMTIDANVGTMQRDYSSRELAVVQGDSVTVLERCGRWALCSFKTEQGWIPDRCLEPERT